MKRLLLFLLLIMFLPACNTGSFPERLEAQNYTNIPQWSAERNQTLTTNFGEIRVFNASSWELDIALLTEIINTHGTPIIKPLELRIFDDRYVERDPVNGFTLSNTNGEAGLTVSSQYQVLSIIPTGWVDEGYIPTCPNANRVYEAEKIVSLDIIHELIVHGFNRASETERSSEEECIAQVFHTQVLEELNGRNLVRR